MGRFGEVMVGVEHKYAAIGSIRIIEEFEIHLVRPHVGQSAEQLGENDGGVHNTHQCCATFGGAGGLRPVGVHRHIEQHPGGFVAVLH